MSGHWPPEWEDPEEEFPEGAGQLDAEAEARLSEVAAYLASVPVPAMPDAVEARISAALAAEAATRAEGRPGAAPRGSLTATARARGRHRGRRGRAGASGGVRRWRPARWRPLAACRRGVRAVATQLFRRPRRAGCRSAPASPGYRARRRSSAAGSGTTRAGGPRRRRPPRRRAAGAPGPTRERADVLRGYRERHQVPAGDAGRAGACQADVQRRAGRAPWGPPSPRRAPVPRPPRRAQLGLGGACST